MILICTTCHHQWNYRGNHKYKYTHCPHCKNRVSLSTLINIQSENTPPLSFSNIANINDPNAINIQEKPTTFRKRMLQDQIKVNGSLSYKPPALNTNSPIIQIEEPLTLLGDDYTKHTHYIQFFKENKIIIKRGLKISHKDLLGLYATWYTSQSHFLYLTLGQARSRFRTFLKKHFYKGNYYSELIYLNIGILPEIKLIEKYPKIKEEDFGKLLNQPKPKPVIPEVFPKIKKNEFDKILHKPRKRKKCVLARPGELTNEQRDMVLSLASKGYYNYDISKELSNKYGIRMTWGGVQMVRSGKGRSKHVTMRVS